MVPVFLTAQGLALAPDLVLVWAQALVQDLVPALGLAMAEVVVRALEQVQAPALGLAPVQARVMVLVPEQGWVQEPVLVRVPELAQAAGLELEQGLESVKEQGMIGLPYKKKNSLTQTHM